MIMKNKRGWIEIVEAFFSILLIVAVVLIILNRNASNTDVSGQIYNVQISILREIETNTTLREEISTAASSDPINPLPVNWTDTGFPIDLKNKVTDRTPSYLISVAKICDLNGECSLGQNIGKNVYSQTVIISATLQQGIVYRKLNLFSWMK